MNSDFGVVDVNAIIYFLGLGGISWICLVV